MRYAVLRHDHPQLHWDLLLESGTACRTWRILELPEGRGPWRVEPIADHRSYYLTYEGPVSGNRGSVEQWDAGQLVWVSATADHVVCLVEGRKWQGRLDVAQPDQPQGTLIYSPRVGT